MANNGTFNKSNWTPFSGEPKSRVYLPQSQSKGIQPQTIAANTTVVLTYSIPSMFKGNGPVEASFPFGQSFQNSTGQPSVGEAWLSQSGVYASGNKPSVNIRLSNAAAVACTITAGTDMVVSQF